MMSGKPITPMVGCDVAVFNEARELLLIRRSDNGLWALPGGCQEVDETPVACAERECLEESGYVVKVQCLLGVYSSCCYEYVHYPWKDSSFTHILYHAELQGGEPTLSSETDEIGWFAQDVLPSLSDGHPIRVSHSFEFLRQPKFVPYFE